MRFTNYFSKITKELGTPQLDTNQFQRMMNIVHLESNVKTLKWLDLNSTKVFQKLGQSESKLSKLTKGLEPEALLEEMSKLSNSNM